MWAMFDNVLNGESNNCGGLMFLKLNFEQILTKQAVFRILSKWLIVCKIVEIDSSKCGSISRCFLQHFKHRQTLHT